MRIPIGAVIQIRTTQGYYGYAQYTHRDPTFGKLLRVFKGRHLTPQTDLNEIIKTPMAFYTFFAINVALKQKEIEMIGQMPDPELLFPILRLITPRDPETKKHRIYAFFDNQKQWKANSILTEEEKSYSDCGSMTSTLLKIYIDEQYSPRHDVE